MIKKLKELCVQYKSILSYGFFGVCTTLLNLLVYYICYERMGIANVVSTCIAWVVAVIFAYFTNKIYVFESKSFEASLVLREMWKFFGVRFLTGVLDVIIMFVGVDVLHGNATLCKIGSNILVIIINYVASKLVIFNRT